MAEQDLKKGSQEAKSFMARLRAMRRRKTGRGIHALGYGGARFRKGSPEAKAFMARLRAMRRGRRKGGMFKGVTHAQLGRLLADAEAAGREGFPIKDKNGVDHQISLDSARRMLEGFRGFKNMTDFWKGKTRAERSNYIKSHYLRGTTHQPWKNMTMARLIKILNRTKANRYPKKFIARRGNPDFVDEWAKLLKSPRDNKAKNVPGVAEENDCDE